MQRFYARHRGLSAPIRGCDKMNIKVVLEMYNIVEKVSEIGVMEEMKLIAFKYGESLFSSKNAFYNDITNEELPFAWLFYLIQGLCESGSDRDC